MLRRGTQVDPGEVSDTALASIAATVRGTLDACDPDTAVLVGLSNLTVTLITITGAFGSPGAFGPPGASGASWAGWLRRRSMGCWRPG